MNNIIKEEILKIVNGKNWNYDPRIELLQKLATLKLVGDQYEKVLLVKDWLTDEKNLSVLLNTLSKHEKWCLEWLLPNLTIEFRGVLECGAFNPEFWSFYMPSTQRVMEWLKKDEPEIKLEVYERDYDMDYDVPTSHKLELGEITVECLE